MKCSKQVIRIRAVSVFFFWHTSLLRATVSWKNLNLHQPSILMYVRPFLEHHHRTGAREDDRPRHIASAATSLSPLLCFLPLLSSYHHCHECAYLPRKDSEWSNAFEICKKGKNDGDERGAATRNSVFCGQLSLVSLADMSTWQTLYHRNNGGKQGTLFQRMVHLRTTQKWIA
jgi:hypothetical protein